MAQAASWSSLSEETHVLLGQGGPLQITLPLPTVSIAGDRADNSGTLDVTLPAAVASGEGGSEVVGDFAITLPSIHSDFSGGVIPTGPLGIELWLPKVTFTNETSPFGDNVIKIPGEVRIVSVTTHGKGYVTNAYRSHHDIVHGDEVTRVDPQGASASVTFHNATAKIGAKPPTLVVDIRND